MENGIGSICERGVCVENDLIYYYTSNKVYTNWLRNEKIWATRSISSNDAIDTIYAKNLFPIINEITKGEFQEKLNEIGSVLQLSSAISCKFYKDLTFQFMTHHFDEFSGIIQNEQERKQWYFYGNNYNLFQIENYHEHCGSFHRQHIVNPSRDQWIFKKLLEALNVRELSNMFNFTRSGIIRQKEYITELPFMYYPFVICFTPEKDNRFFWDAYTGNQGVALEFSRDELTKYLNEISKDKKYRYRLEDVIYNEEEQKDDIIKVLTENEGELLFTGVEKFSLTMAKYKHPYWKDEHEIRAILGECYFDNSSVINENYNMKYDNNMVTQDYIKITIPHKLVKRVIIGPQNEMVNNKTIKEVNDLLAGCTFEIELSNGYGVSRT
jgi:hypothetical protein